MHLQLLVVSNNWGAFHNRGTFLLAGIGARTIVEGICLHLKIESGPVINTLNGDVKVKANLVGKINGLVEKNIINTDGAQILHDIRKLGNETAHALIDPSQIIIKKVIEIIEHMFTFIYELPEYKSY